MLAIMTTIVGSAAVILKVAWHLGGFEKDRRLQKDRENKEREYLQSYKYKMRGKTGMSYRIN